MKKLERLKRPTINSFHYDPYEQSPLLKFNLNAIKKNQRCVFLQKQAIQVGFRMLDTSLT